MESYYERDGRCVLYLEHFYTHKPERVFRCITDPDYFTKSYPFATGKMDLNEGDNFDFGDGEGTMKE